VGYGRYVVLGFLDSAITTLALAPVARETDLAGMLALASVVTMINLLTAFMAEYTEERSRMRRMERSLFLRRGFMLRTIIHRQALQAALIRGLIFGTVSMGSAMIIQLSMNTLVLSWIPIIPIVLLGVFGSLMSRYFGGNGFLWFLVYITIGLAAVYLGRSLSPLIR